MSVSREIPCVGIRVKKEQEHLTVLCQLWPIFLAAVKYIVPLKLWWLGHISRLDGKLGVPSIARGWELLFNWVEP